MLNTSSRLEWSDFTAPALIDYFARMKVAGYDEKFSKITLQKGLRTYDKMLDDARDGKRPVHRPKDWQPSARRRKKRDKKPVTQKYKLFQIADSRIHNISR